MSDAFREFRELVLHNIEHCDGADLVIPEELCIELVSTSKPFIKQLSDYICTAFNNEEAFLNRFYVNLDGGPVELQECYMASIATRISIQVGTGVTMLKTIKTAEFIDWCDEMKQACQHD